MDWRMRFVKVLDGLLVNQVKIKTQKPVTEEPPETEANSAGCGFLYSKQGLFRMSTVTVTVMTTRGPGVIMTPITAGQPERSTVYATTCQGWVETQPPSFHARHPGHKHRT
jgi:hypothetical protein